MNELDFSFDYDLVQSQKLLLTPQMKQVIDILKMNTQQLSRYIEEQLEENPLLEIVENTSYDDYLYDFLKDDCSMYSGSEDTYQRDFDTYEKSMYENLIDNSRQATLLSLKEHLLFQLHTSKLPKTDIDIGEYIIDNTDENGYFITDTKKAADYLEISEAKLLSILKELQSFDPPGVCARDLKECLIIQLKQNNECDSDIEKIVNNYLDELADGNIEYISEKAQVKAERVKEIFEIIKKLEPKPGRSFINNESVKYIIPDIIVRKASGKYEAYVNEEALPVVHINKYYRRIINRDISEDTRNYIKAKIQNAANLIKCIEYRKNIMKNIAEYIIDNQYEFFDEGIKNLKPLSLEIIAQRLNMHETLVSRIINGKYIQCSWGIFELKYFFTGRVSKQVKQPVANEFK